MQRSNGHIRNVEFLHVLTRRAELRHLGADGWWTARWTSRQPMSRDGKPLKVLLKPSASALFAILRAYMQAC